MRVGTSLLCLLGALILVVGFSAQALVVQSGLAPNQVVQCDQEGKASLVMSGTASKSGALQVRVMGTQKEVIGWTDLGKASKKNWKGTLPGVPAGGPYRVELRVRGLTHNVLEETAIPDVLAGDVWVLAGQSNMQGVGNRVNVEAPHPLVHTFAMSYEWRLAEEPLHTLAESPDKIHANFKNEKEREDAIKGWRDGPKGTGLGIAFAKEMVKRTGRPVGLVASAHGGTSMDQWNPALKDQVAHRSMVRCASRWRRRAARCAACCGIKANRTRVLTLSRSTGRR